ncbi:MAG: DUF5703 domain-containing protein [Niabella sp.]
MAAPYWRTGRNIIQLVALLLLGAGVAAQTAIPYSYDVIWNRQSENAAGSMPVGGGDIGCNAWMERNELLLYFSKSGSFDENNTFLKGGRLRLRFSPNPFSNASFKQELILKDGYINIESVNNNIHIQLKIWVDVFSPVIHIEAQSNKALTAEAIYENWRFADRIQTGKENNANSWKWVKQVTVVNRKDTVEPRGNQVVFYHRNIGPTVFDATLRQQGLDSVKSRIFNPLENLTSGGLLKGDGFIQGVQGGGIYVNTPYKSQSLISRRPSKQQALQIFLYNSQAPAITAWRSALDSMAVHYKPSHSKTIAWWNRFWNRSFILIGNDATSTTDNAVRGLPAGQAGKTDAVSTSAGYIRNEKDEAWQAGRNYQLFRYMLGCNAYGKYPTKFNGGLFTVDPFFTDSTIKSTPDYRNWGGGTFTAQNQRLVYWPMLKSGDADMMKPQFYFYNNLLQTALLRTKIYWGHNGANFNEQIENCGLPNPAEYGFKRPAGFEPGMEYNAWLEYEWDTVLEFCMMILQSHDYEGADISGYLPLIKECLIFFDEHYQWLALQRSARALDSDGHLILYPGSGAETFKMAYNASSTIAALKTVTAALLVLPAGYLTTEEQLYFTAFKNRIPPIPFTSYNGHTTIAPAIAWARVNNTESPQLYPVFPWGMYGIGRPGLDTARNTYLYDTFALKFRGAVGWKQDNIFAARLGLIADAERLTLQKLKNSGRRFPAFWGPGYDWVPDHNWGGSGMIGLQEMLLQAVDDKIYLFPAWPKNRDVHFKLHAPRQTIVEAVLKNGKLVRLEVIPKAREKDVIVQ